MKRTNLQRCFVLFFSACMTTSLLAADLIHWAPDIETARQAAVAQNKLMLIHFWTPDCPPCKTVDRQVFPTPSVAQAVHENFVPLKVNAYEHADLRLQFQVDRWPTDVIATADGQIVHKMVTPLDPHTYVRQLAAIAAAQNPRPVNSSPWADGPSADLNLYLLLTA